MNKNTDMPENDFPGKGNPETADETAREEIREEAEIEETAEEAGEAIPETGQENVEEADPATVEAALKEEVAALNDKYLRLFAEFDNFKRRSVKERMDLIGTASKNVILSLLPVLDDFDRAQKSMESAEDVEAIREGVDLIVTKFRKILIQQGLKEMEAIGTPFDADLHEAVSNVPAPSEEMKGKVVDQLEKGYYLNDKVIRYAKVFVGA